MPSGLSLHGALTVVHGELDACRACPNMIGPVVHGPPIASKILLVGQAPGPREGSFGRPFAWTAGRTLFRWFEQALGATEAEVRSKIYFAAVARCFPGKARGGGDRRPDAAEIGRCRSFLARETAILSPELVLPVGSLAIEQVLGPKAKLAHVVGTKLRARYHDVEVTVIALPHPSGVSTWHKLEPGKTLLARAMKLIAQHPAVRAAFPSQGMIRPPARTSSATGRGRDSASAPAAASSSRSLAPRRRTRP